METNQNNRFWGVDPSTITLPSPQEASLPSRYSNQALKILYVLGFDTEKLQQKSARIENLGFGIRGKHLTDNESYRASFSLGVNDSTNLVENPIVPESANFILAEIQIMDATGYAHSVGAIVDKGVNPMKIYYNDPMGSEPPMNLQEAMRERWGNNCQILILPGQRQQDANACSVFTYHNLLNTLDNLDKLGTTQFELERRPLGQMVAEDRARLASTRETDQSTMRIRVIPPESRIRILGTKTEEKKHSRIKLILPGDRER